MADKKDAAVTKAAPKPPAASKSATKSPAAKSGNAAAKKGKPHKRVKLDPIARAKKILSLRLLSKRSGKVRRGGIGKRNRKARKVRKALREAGKVPPKEAKAAKPATKEKTEKAVKRPAPEERKDVKTKDGPPKKRLRASVRHPIKHIASGVMKYCKPLKFRMRGHWKVSASKARKATPKKPRIVKKEIGGDKNGGFRMVLVKKRRQSYPTTEPIRKRRARGLFKNHKRYIRSSLKRGTICILLAGPHRGKRVVLLRVLETGLLLVNGPYYINGCPLRRVHPNYVIATHTRLNVPKTSIPTHLNDTYFRRIRAAKKAKKEERDIFSTKKEKYVPSQQRKADQKRMDRVIKRAIVEYSMKHGKQRTVMRKYLKAVFGLRRNQNPHSLRF